MPVTPKKNTQRAQIVAMRRSTVMIILIAVIASATLIITSCGDNSQSSEEVKITYNTPVDTTPVITTTETEAPLVLLPEAEEPLAKNGDSAGWITIDGIIDEVIVQMPGDEKEGNVYYVENNYQRKKDVGGAIFADYRNILDGRKTSDNIVLYGHNQKDNSRFGNLDLYKWNLNYYKSKPLVSFRTNYEERQYKIMAIFVTSVEPEQDDGNVFDYHNYIDFSDETRYNEFIEETMKRSLILPGVDSVYGDKFLTLSTCSTEFDPSRLVFVCRQVREGESSEVDMTNFKINPNPKWPAVYYKFHGGSYAE